MAGLPGVGKSAIAEGLVRALDGVLFSVDPVEAALLRAGVDRSEPTGLAAYVVVEDLARIQLRLGRPVVVDAVNAVEPARAQWRELAAEQRVPMTFVEVVCSDPAEHRRRLAGRDRGLVGFPEPTWEDVGRRRGEFEEWSHDDRVLIDSMQPLERCVAGVLDQLSERTGSSERTAPDQ